MALHFYFIFTNNRFCHYNLALGAKEQIRKLVMVFLYAQSEAELYQVRNIHKTLNLIHFIDLFFLKSFIA